MPLPSFFLLKLYLISSYEDDGIYRCFATRRSSFYQRQTVYVETEVSYQNNVGFGGCGGSIGSGGGGGTFGSSCGK